MESQSLNHEELASLALSRFNYNIEKPRVKLSQLPTLKIMYECLKEFNETGKIPEQLDNLLVIPKELNNESDVFFKYDTWFIDKDATNSKVHVSKCVSPRLTLELKIISTVEMWILPRKSKATSLFRKLDILKRIAKACMELNILSLFHLGQETHYQKVINKLKETCSKRSLNNYIQALSTLSEMYDIGLGEYGFGCKRLFERFSEQTEESNQTYCMPFGIFSQLWVSASALPSEFCDDFFYEVKEITKFAHEMLKEFNSLNITSAKNKDELYRFISNRHYQAVLRSHYQKYGKLGYVVSVDDALMTRAASTKKIYKRMKKYNVDYYVSAKDFGHYLTRVLSLCVMYIGVGTGMRVNEFIEVKNNGLIEDDINGYIGVRSKLSKFAPENGLLVPWAAAPFVKDIFMLANRLSNSIFYTLSKSDINENRIAHNVLTYLTTKKIKRVTKGHISKNILVKYLENYGLKLTSKDVNEFYQLNKNLGREDDVEHEIYEGGYWPLRTHQFRRSIAVHTRRLGTLSSKELSFQLKHLSRTQTEWYADGGYENSLLKIAVPEIMSMSWYEEELLISAESAVELQYSPHIFGKGGDTLKKGQSDETAKIYPDLPTALKLARRNKSVVKSIGNGLYCLNGNECKMSSVIQVSSCSINCESFVGDARASKSWLRSYKYYDNVIQNLIESKGSEAKLQYLTLERDGYKELLDFAGVHYE